MHKIIPDSKVHGPNMGPIWGRQDLGGPHVGPTNFVIWGNSGVTWATRRFKSPSNQASTNDNITAPHYCPFVRESTIDRWIPLSRKGHWRIRCLYVMRSSCKKVIKPGQVSSIDFIYDMAAFFIFATTWKWWLSASLWYLHCCFSIFTQGLGLTQFLVWPKAWPCRYRWLKGGWMVTQRSDITLGI